MQHLMSFICHCGICMDCFVKWQMSQQAMVGSYQLPKYFLSITYSVNATVTGLLSRGLHEDGMPQ